MRIEDKVGLFVAVMLIVIFGSLYVVLKTGRDRYEPQMSQNKQAEQEFDIVCVDGVEYVSYKGSLSVKFNSDGSLSRCKNEN